jgi:prepilin-type N-terminal cleavage/methylation domain-containing protein
MKVYFQSQEGLTLIEVLVSIVMLSIILISFIGVFTQSAQFNNKNRQKLGTIDTSRENHQ